MIMKSEWGAEHRPIPSWELGCLQFLWWPTDLPSGICNMKHWFPWEILLLFIAGSVFPRIKYSHYWIKKDQVYVTCFIISLFNAQYVSDVNTSILRSLRIMCWVISWDVLIWFDVCWCYVLVWLWWCGIRMQAQVCIRIPHHHSQTRT